MSTEKQYDKSSLSKQNNAVKLNQSQENITGETKGSKENPHFLDSEASI